MLAKDKEYTMHDIIDYIVGLYKEQGESSVCADNNWCIYSGDIDVELDTKCIVSDYPDYDDDDNEILPATIEQLDFCLVYRDEMIQDVIINALIQKPAVSTDTIMDAIRYYDEHDCFMVIS